MFSIDFLSHIANIYWRRRRSKIPKVCLDLIFNLYRHYGRIAEFNLPCAEGMNTHYMII